MKTTAQLATALAVVSSAGLASAEGSFPSMNFAAFVGASSRPLLGPAGIRVSRVSGAMPGILSISAMARGDRRGAGRRGAAGGRSGGAGSREGGGEARGAKAEKTRNRRQDLNQLLKQGQGTKTLEVQRSNIKPDDWDPKTMAPGSVRFLGSFDDQPPKLGLPEVAFVGRSNVGKSSLLNSLTRSKIAVTSKTPGRTQRVNIFAWKEAKRQGRVVALVDLPGFGFAKIRQGRKDAISGLLGGYLSERDALKLVIVLVDLRLAEVQKADLDAMELLYSLDIPFLVVGTKADKLSNNELDTSMRRLEADLGLDEGQLIASSSVSGEGRQFVWKQIMLGLFDADDSLDLDDDDVDGDDA